MTTRIIAARLTACALASASLSTVAAAQSAQPAASLPPLEVTAPKKAVAVPKKTKSVQTQSQKPKPTPASQPLPAPPPASRQALTGSALERSGSIASPNTSEARAEIQRTPGAVEVIPDTAYKSSTPAATIKDVLDYTPGVFAQPKWGDDTRLSIRGSSLSRNFHLRGIQLYMDGIPINTADGYGDFQEIDPTAYRYVEVFKGANAMRFGANSLGGAINFVMPTGYDAAALGARVDFGSFGFRKAAVNSGGVYGAADYFINVTAQEADGFRDHSDGESLRGSMNLGYRLSPDVETRFYLNANTVDQRIPGSVTKRSALTDPEAAAVGNIIGDQQRNIDTLRIANKTAMRMSETTMLETGVFYVDRHLMHPIFQWLDYQYDDVGGFARLTDERSIGGYKNRLIAGLNLHYGTIDAQQFVNVGGEKGAPTFASEDKSGNASAYIENSFYLMPAVALVSGFQFLNATRERDAKLGGASGDKEFNIWSPKVGLLWDIDPTWQAFANISRSAEVPSFGENNFASISNVKAQRATTYEIGTRGRRPDYSWDFAIYRAEIDDELQCMDTNTPGQCTVVNLDQTIHQGVEIGFGWAVWKGLIASGPAPDKLWLNTAYTFNDFRFDNDSDYGDNELPGAPRHYLRAELLYKHPSGVYFGPNIEWVPDAYYVDNQNTFDTEAYAIWGAKLGYETETFSAYVEGRNLSDRAYIASSSIATQANASNLLFEPGTGRAIYGGVSVKW